LGERTVSVADPVTSPLAEIVVLPGATPRARPVALIVATAVLDEDHVTPVSRSTTRPLLSRPVAVYFSGLPGAIVR